MNDKPGFGTVARLFLKTSLLNFFRGFLMGTADLVPGFSGGTAALILGIYERVVSFLSGLGHFFVHFAARLAPKREKSQKEPSQEGHITGELKSLDFKFALFLGAGILTAIFSLSTLLKSLLENYPEEAAGLFLGLVAAAAVILLIFSSKTPIIWFVTAATGGIIFWVLGFQAGVSSNPGIFVYLGSGVLASMAMILPGVSGSFVLLMIGMYGPFIDAVSDFEIINLLFMAVGVLAGLSAFSGLLKFLLAKYGNYMLAILSGLMLGSIRVLWPWPEGVGILDREQENVIDGTGLELPELSTFWLPTLLALAGAAIVGMFYIKRPLDFQVVNYKK